MSSILSEPEVIAAVVAAVIAAIASYKNSQSNLANQKEIAALSQNFQKSQQELNNEYQIALNELNNNFNIALEELRNQQSKDFLHFSLHQNKLFESLVELWSSMAELKLQGESLWENNRQTSLNKFKSTLYNCILYLEKARIILPDNIYFEMKETLNTFKEYASGKEALSNLRDEFKTTGHIFDYNDYNNINSYTKQVDLNKVNKTRYEQSLDVLYLHIKHVYTVN
ncbi:hypothetical protein KEH51_15745 [[Brevibacterium] frigoritolerans]|uniref:Uncharacterized protein n=1 Tax=Peribacillus frigoritolerans TaxID=450367 RepID=A0A941FRC6_9BACI|nr:hypothetical protein [Peribacillus frigoritolerans]